jgi:quercetin dioxygenase-like cupin family protein
MDAQALIVLPGQGRVWNMDVDCRPATFKLLSDQTQESISVFEETIPAGGGTSFHIHPVSDEVIHILAGEFIIKIGEQVTTIGAGTWVFIPRGTPHAWKNIGSDDGRAFYIFTPAQNAKFLEELSILEAPMMSDLTKFELYCQQYGFEVLDIDPFG